MSRVALLVALALGLLTAPAPAGNGAPATRMIVLGVDGMDPQLLRGLIAAGDTPNLARLAQQGGFIELGTSVPPQSPVAWSNLITGMGPGGHGIFDFIAIDRDSMLPYMSTARVEKSSWKPLSIGRYRLPLGGDKTLQLRDGVPFWQVLEDADVPTTLFRMPANYPPAPGRGHAVSGMGTPDLRGTSGTFAYYTDDPELEAGAVSGGIIQRVTRVGQRVQARLEGPKNPFIEDAPRSSAGFEVVIDQENPVALVRAGGSDTLLREGEWSDWVAVDFELLPLLASVPGMVRFYLQSLRPHFRLYVSPVNIDPRDAAQPISIPADYAHELAEAAGPFYTQEMPEDTKALSAAVLSPGEFLEQSGLVFAERQRLLRHELARFRNEQKRGLFFFYLSSIDQRSHMLWRQMDGAHPHHESDTAPGLRQALRTSYMEVDALVGEVMRDLAAGTTLVVMSDHGFAPFSHQVHLNSWLEQNGYLVLRDPARRDRSEWLLGVDWSRTRAYAVGLNSLYLNVRGRERQGVVDPAQRETLAREIAAGLAAWKDPKTGAQIVTQPLPREDVYEGAHLESAPDILVGYARGYRASWATTTGKVPAGLLEDNLREWSGDHCMDSRSVPGILISSRPIRAKSADLRDLTVSILEGLGVAAPDWMHGSNVF